MKRPALVWAAIGLGDEKLERSCTIDRFVPVFFSYPSFNGTSQYSLHVVRTARKTLDAFFVFGKDVRFLVVSDTAADL
jgi:hypothetical protein